MPWLLAGLQLHCATLRLPLELAPSPLEMQNCEKRSWKSTDKKGAPWSQELVDTRTCLCREFCEHLSNSSLVNQLWTELLAKNMWPVLPGYDAPGIQWAEDAACSRSCTSWSLLGGQSLAAHYEFHAVLHRRADGHVQIAHLLKAKNGMCHSDIRFSLCLERPRKWWVQSRLWRRPMFSSIRCHRFRRRWIRSVPPQWCEWSWHPPPEMSR